MLQLTLNITSFVHSSFVLIERKSSNKNVMAQQPNITSICVMINSKSEIGKGISIFLPLCTEGLNSFDCINHCPPQVWDARLLELMFYNYMGKVTSYLNLVLNMLEIQARIHSDHGQSSILSIFSLILFQL